MSKILYKQGYKYQLLQDYILQTGIKIHKNIYTEYVSMSETGLIMIKKGYAWDGPSGPAIDTRNFMRGSLVHDGLYQIMRQGKLNHNKYREKVDNLLKTMCLEDGMCTIRAWWVYTSIRYFGEKYATPTVVTDILTAP
jgi:hypothetical protein